MHPEEKFCPVTIKMEGVNPAGGAPGGPGTSVRRGMPAIGPES
ncbi:hypothetical protein ASZ90_010740 [hydrocarbon metagenome]|uniref:Uncharacterized protein n=1 Tax=hydrocarbon metagenome TaxID=938273 RepID=A0A0W8FF41_9ZZZZ